MGEEESTGRVEEGEKRRSKMRESLNLIYHLKHLKAWKEAHSLQDLPWHPSNSLMHPYCFWVSMFCELSSIFVCRGFLPNNQQDSRLNQTLVQGGCCAGEVVEKSTYQSVRIIYMIMSTLKKASFFCKKVEKQTNFCSQYHIFFGKQTAHRPLCIWCNGLYPYIIPI